ncbi:ComEA family DNA-binding protein [Streptomyces sp. NPDC004610]|uniref:ComEA family DNA-binding protein n=1 Tax=unclassified Streptomyces TaxID=2593676 RepID=UPI0033AEEA77
MALRARSHSRSATSGPGRRPGSDSRSRQRRSPVRGRARHGHASARELRRRADLIFGETGGVEEGAGVGVGPPGVEAPVADLEWRVGPSGRGGGVSAGSRWGRVSAAVRERMPVWLQTRVGLERRSVVALTVVLVLAAGFAVHHFWTGRPQGVRAPEIVEAAEPFGKREGEAKAGAGAAAGAVPGAGEATGAAGGVVVVDVGGKVREPGVHRLPVGSRVEDALSAAGGVRPGAKLDGLNRARVLVDGEQVVVGEPAPPGAPVGTGMGTGAAEGVPGAGAAGPVSLNTATLEQLDSLPGVGPVLAQHILDHRTQQGGFRSVDELRDVKGIGERRFADLRDLVRP